MGELCRHIHEASHSREAAMVFGFSRLAKEMMNGHGQGIRKIVVKVEFVEIQIALLGFQGSQPTVRTWMHNKPGLTFEPQL